MRVFPCEIVTMRELSESWDSRPIGKSRTMKIEAIGWEFMRPRLGGSLCMVSEMVLPYTVSTIATTIHTRTNGAARLTVTNIY